MRRIKGADYQIVSEGSAYTQWRTVGVFPLNEIMSQVSSIRYYSLIIAGVTVLVALIVAVFFTGGIARPVIELRSLMKEAEEGNLSVRFEGRQEDEIGYLGKSFNTMIEEVQKLIDMVYQRAAEQAGGGAEDPPGADQAALPLQHPGHHPVDGAGARRPGHRAASWAP